MWRTSRRKAAHLLLLLYLAGSAAFFLNVALPALRGDLDLQFYADSRTYEDMAGDQARLGDLVQVGLNALGPRLILQALNRDRLLVYLFNVTLFLASYRLLRASHPLDPLRLALALVLSPVMFSSLMSVNKEILALLAIALVAAFYAKRHPLFLAGALLVSPLVRWQFTLFVLIVVGLDLRPLRRHRRLSVAALLLACSIGYPILLRSGLFESVDEIAQNEARAALEGSGAYSIWLAGQARFAYFLVFPLKALHLFVGLLARIGNITDWSDFYNNVVATLQSAANLGILTLTLRRWWQGRVPLEGPAFLALVYSIVFVLSPIYSPRYLFPVYVLLCVVVAQSAEVPEDVPVNAGVAASEATVQPSGNSPSP